jgi:hypothetical protein
MRITAINKSTLNRDIGLAPNGAQISRASRRQTLSLVGLYTGHNAFELITIGSVAKERDRGATTLC